MEKYTRQSKIKETCNERKHTVSLFCAWNITTVEINSGIHLLKNEIHQLPLFTSGGLGLKNYFGLVYITEYYTVGSGPRSDVMRYGARDRGGYRSNSIRDGYRIISFGETQK